MNRIPNTILVKGKRKVCRIFDAGEKFADRYTVAFRCVDLSTGRVYPYLASGSRPFHPQGFGQHCESDTFLKGAHLGKRVRFEDVPEDVQKFILQNI